MGYFSKRQKLFLHRFHAQILTSTMHRQNCLPEMVEMSGIIRTLQPFDLLGNSFYKSKTSRYCFEKKIFVYILKKENSLYCQVTFEKLCEINRRRRPTDSEQKTQKTMTGMIVSALHVILAFLAFAGVEGQDRRPTISYITQPEIVTDIGGTVEMKCSVQYAKDYPVVWMKLDQVDRNNDLPITSGKQ